MDSGVVRAVGPVVFRSWYVVVWCSKYRRRVLTSEDPDVGNPPLARDPGPVDVRLAEILAQVAGEAGAVVEDVVVAPDHVRVRVSVDPTYGIGKLVRTFKAKSSRLLRAEFPSLRRRLPTLWTTSYFVATVGRDPKALIEEYLAGQRNT
jgi:putative transposase